ncbi:uncharacterized protein B0I36DRAFT_349819 [Microdochium trichocladiopsis]|uniref:Uncharacterized protein n=1 Tax=Microdochium trichocladiopsis TaxID=1682393 RepID=A0A9P9BP30_9PEZI|nr:uncharacterized protein B0I36DRAFT_349819 [Microdochium trichocladiopsis]KAH7028827.1 hypothetical protein B0I36DRAFT_349819 [Microdochium trichocladiopsis]
MARTVGSPPGPAAAASSPARGRPLAVTLLFTVLFAACASCGYWYNRVYQVGTPFIQDFEAHLKTGLLADDKTPLKRGAWTGHQGTDELLTLLALFFSPGSYGHGSGGFSGRAVMVQQAQLLLQLVSVLTLQMVEGYRGRNRWTLLSFPSIWAFFYQTMSGMFIFPVWYAVHTLLSHRASYFSAPASTSSSGLAISRPFAKALLPAILVLYVVPTIAMYIPYANPEINQDAAAFWQATPAYVNVALWVLALTVFRGGDSSSSSTISTARSSSSARHVNRAYALAFVVGVLTHISVVWLVMTSSPEQDPSMSFSALFVPTLDLHNALPGSPAAGIVWGTLRMFQFDHIGIFASTLLWAVLGIYDVQTRLGAAGGEKEGGAVVVPILALLAGVVVLGPGAALAAFGVWREKKLAGAAASSTTVAGRVEGKKRQ